MSYIKRALAAPAMAAAAAGAGLRMAVAGAVPAYAAVPGPPAGGHTATVTHRLAAPAARGISPKAGGAPGTAVEECAAAGAGCVPAPTITCWIKQQIPMQTFGNTMIWTQGRVDCDHNVAQIDVQNTLLQNGNSIYLTSNSQVNWYTAEANIEVPCQLGTYTNHAIATITFPDGFSAGLHIDSDATPVSINTCVLPPPPGGGGGCATGSPSPAPSPAARHRDVIACP
jgi:hypothetical protein